MAKNKGFINRQKVFHQKIAGLLPQAYAAVAMALWNTLDMPDAEKTDAIEVIFAESQRIWQECADNHMNIIQMCRELTGIDVVKGE